MDTLTEFKISNYYISGGNSPATTLPDGTRLPGFYQPCKIEATVVATVPNGYDHSHLLSESLWRKNDVEARDRFSDEYAVLNLVLMELGGIRKALGVPADMSEIKLDESISSGTPTELVRTLLKEVLALKTSIINQ